MFYPTHGLSALVWNWYVELSTWTRDRLPKWECDSVTYAHLTTERRFQSAVEFLPPKGSTTSYSKKTFFSPFHPKCKQDDVVEKASKLVVWTSLCLRLKQNPTDTVLGVSFLKIFTGTPTIIFTRKHTHTHTQYELGCCLFLFIFSFRCIYSAWTRASLPPRNNLPFSPLVWKKTINRRCLFIWFASVLIDFTLFAFPIWLTAKWDSALATLLPFIF